MQTGLVVDDGVHSRFTASTTVAALLAVGLLAGRLDENHTDIHPFLSYMVAESTDDLAICLARVSADDIGAIGLMVAHTERVGETGATT